MTRAKYNGSTGRITFAARHRYAVAGDAFISSHRKFFDAIRHCNRLRKEFKSQIYVYFWAQGRWWKV